MKGNVVKGRFTAYVVAAVVHRRIRYLTRSRKLRERELSQDNRQERLQVDFEIQYCAYLRETTDFVLEDWARFPEFLKLAEDTRLSEILGRLQEKEKVLLFARVFGELGFGEVGRILGIKPKQAEMAYYYLLRKLRRMMEV